MKRKVVKGRLESGKVKALSEMTTKERIYNVIFESDTLLGKVFDVTLLLFITISIILVMVDSMNILPQGSDRWIRASEWVITGFFTLEYILRIYCSHRPLRYVFSFYGVIDLLSTLPLYLSFFLPGAAYLIIIRAFRLIRVFRVFRLFSFMAEGNILLHALKNSAKKIFVFFLFVLILTITIGTVMFVIEGGQGNEGFDNILNSIYWTIVTLTTVGYGDITPVTGLGRFLSAVVMLLGYTIIAVPTGIVSANIIKDTNNEMQKCSHCGKQNDRDASYCKHCGSSLSDEAEFLS